MTDHADEHSDIDSAPKKRKRGPSKKKKTETSDVKVAVEEE